MRDKEYAKGPAPRTQRIALLGSSVVMGSGVGDGDSFESLIETRLNLEHSPEPYERYEILNLAVGGYGPLEQAVVVDQRVFEFDPGVVFYIAHHSDTKRAINHLAKALTRGFELPYEELRRIARAAGVDGGVPETLAQARLAAFGDELVSFVYQRIVAACQERGVMPVWIFLPTLGDRKVPEDPAVLTTIAREAGFRVVVLDDVYQGFDRKALWVSTADSHPNREGHRIIADRMYRGLRDLDRREGLGLFSVPAAQ